MNQSPHQHWHQPWTAEIPDLLIEGACDVLFHVIGGQLAWISDSIEALLGWRPEELHHLSIDHLAHPSEPAALRALVLAAATGKQAEADARLRHRDGHWRWAHISLAPRGDPAVAIGCLRDIHGQVAQRQRLQASYRSLVESEARYRLLAENAADVLFQADPSGIPTWFSASVTELTGWLPMELIGQPLELLVHPDHRPLYREALTALGGGGPQRFEVKLRCKDGHDTWMVFSLRRLDDGDGSTIGMVGGWRDSGEVAQRGELLVPACREKIEAEDLLEKVLDHTAIGLCLISPDGGHLVKVNPALCEILSRNEKSLLLSIWPELAHPEDRNADCGLIEEIKANHIPSGRLAKRLLRPNGETIWGDLSISCIRNDDQSVRFLIVQIVDITEQRESSFKAAENQSLLNTILSHIAVHVYMKDRSGRYLYVNRRLAEMVGCPAHEIMGKTDAAFFAADLVAAVTAVEEEVFLSGKPIHREETILTASGEERTFLVEKVLLSCQGQADCLIGYATDITALKRVEQALRESEQHYRLLTENSSDVVLLLDDDGRISWVSPGLRAALGWYPDEWRGHSYTSFFACQSETLQYREKQERLRRGESIITREQILAKDRQLHWIETHVSPYRDGAAQVSGSVARFRVIDEEVASEEALRRSEEHHRLLADNALDVIWTMELDGTISHISPSVEKLWGFTVAEVYSQPLGQIETPQSAVMSANYLQQLKSAVASGKKLENFHAELEYYRKDGSTTWCEVIAIPLLDQQGSFVQLLGTSRNIQKRKLHELELQQARDQAQAARLALIEANRVLSSANKKLQALATTDSLTGIFNRRTFETRLDEEMARSFRYGSALSLVMFDIDNFKSINDSHGHQVGDEVLVEICQRISRHLRRSDILARWGGEEFMVLLPHCNDVKGRKLAEKLRNLIVTEPIGLVQSASASFGVTQLQEGEERDHLLQRLDGALYQAKTLGRNRVVRA